MPTRVAIKGSAGSPRSRRGAPRFDAEAALATLFVAVQRAATELARDRGWDVETRLVSAGQAFGLLSRAVLRACRASDLPSPRILPYARRSLDLAGQPTLATTAALCARLRDGGAIPALPGEGGVMDPEDGAAPAPRMQPAAVPSEH